MFSYDATFDVVGEVLTALPLQAEEELSYAFGENALTLLGISQTKEGVILQSLHSYPNESKSVLSHSSFRFMI